MYRKEVNQRSPLRVFERSTHGGLGRGNLGVSMSRAGVGKTAFLVDIALDDLMRERKVLHVNLDNPVEKVREFYDEVFHDLAESTGLEERNKVHLSVERHRMIQTYAGGSFTMEKLRNALELIQQHMQFKPDMIVMDGYPKLQDASVDQVREIKELAKELDCEIWLTCQCSREDNYDDRGVPDYMLPFEDFLSVIVRLQSDADHVRLNLLKDHDATDLADLHIELDPKTLLLKWL